MTEERAYWLAWTQIQGVGSVLLHRLQQHFDSLATAWTASSKELAQVEGLGKQTAETVVQERSRFSPQEFLVEHQKENPCFWTPADANYPRLLLEIPSPPPVLYYRGTIDWQEIQGKTPTVAIVGTRTPSEYGKRWTRRISSALAKNGFTVISGLAAGIDTEAHQSCLEAGGRTIAVFGTGVDIVYPSVNKKLGERILTQGLALSEYPAGTKPHKSNFPRRNRIIAGLSRAVLVMEAPQKSGALITAYQANEFCRDVYVLTARLDDDRSIGCLELLNKGAYPIPPNSDRLLSEERLLEMLGAIPKLDPNPTSPVAASPCPETPKASLELEPELAKVLAAIAVEPLSLDAIVERASLPIATVSSALLQLELMELIAQQPGMRYCRF